MYSAVMTPHPLRHPDKYLRDLLGVLFPRHKVQEKGDAFW